MKLFGSIKEVVKVVFRQNGQEIELDSNQGTTYTGTRLHQLPPGDSSQTLVSEDATQTLSNKTIDVDSNTVTNIDNDNIKALAGIAATKIADGSVDNTEFQRLNSAGTAGAGNIVTTDGTQTLTGKTIDGDDNTVQDLPISSIKTVLGDANEVLRRDASGVAVSGPNTLPNTSVIVTEDATQTLTNKSIDGDDNTVTDLAITAIKTVLADADKVLVRDASGVPTSAKLVNANIDAAAAIAYSKLALTSSIVDGDLTTNSVNFDKLSTTTCTIDEDDMSSDSAVRLPTQQSVKAYVDTQIASVSSTGTLYSAKSADYTILDNDNIRTVGVATSSVDITITLPSAASNTDRIITVKKTDSNAFKVIVAGTIDGVSNFNLYLQKDAITVQSDGTEWVLLNKSLSLATDYLGLGGNGYGSVDTSVRRFSGNTSGNGGVVTAGGGVGQYWTCTVPGLYECTFRDFRSGGQAWLAITKNSTKLTDGSQPLATESHTEDYNFAENNQAGQTTTIVSCAAGDVIRFQSVNATSTANDCFGRIRMVARL